MNKAGSATKVKLNSFDDLFGIEQPQSGIEQVQEIALTELQGFKEHPFKVLDDEKMQEMIESIREYGILIPGIARRMKDSGYEIIAGHRRKYACEMVGLSTMPMFIRDYTDDEATIIMVDSNIQREDILPSEKSKAYRMKYDAMKHQGSKAGGLTLGELGEAAGESAKTVQRYIWISRLADELLDMVDTKKIGIIQAVDLSFLSEVAQQWVLAVISENQTFGSSEIETQEVGESNPNYTKYNKTDLNYIEESYINPIIQSGSEKNDVIDDVQKCIELIKENISYNHHMKYDSYGEKELYDELFQVICEVVCVRRPTIRVAGEEYPYELVKSRFLKLESGHLEYVIDCMKNTTTKITNIKAYIITALYNATTTINHFYQQEVNHDMYGGGWCKKDII